MKILELKIYIIANIKNGWLVNRLDIAPQKCKIEGRSREK